MRDATISKSNCTYEGMNECRSGNVCHLADGRPTTSGSIKLSCESPNNTCTDFAAESSYQREFCRYVPPPTLSSYGAKNMNALKYFVFHRLYARGHHTIPQTIV